MKFENKVVIVTGASSGIGEGVAKMFLEEGARLVGCGIEPAMKIESEKAIYVQADLTDPAQAQNVVDKAVEPLARWTSWCAAPASPSSALWRIPSTTPLCGKSPSTWAACSTCARPL